MADLKISQLPAYASGSVAPAIDLIPIVDTTNTTTKAITVAALFIAGLLSPPTIGGTTPGLISGTTITATAAFVAPVGLVGTPGYTFAGNLNYGWYLTNATIAATVAGTVRGGFDSSGNLLVVSNGMFAFTSTTAITSAADVLLA